MRLLLRFAMVFFGTLLAAALFALGEPPQGDAATQLAHHDAGHGAR